VKTGESVSEMLTLGYGEYAIQIECFEWRRHFKEGRENVQDDTRSRQPEPQRSDANVDRVRTLVHLDRRLGVKPIARSLRKSFRRRGPNSTGLKVSRVFG
jgi:hypothetical protein